jgi:hypothetical protein
VALGAATREELAVRRERRVGGVGLVSLSGGQRPAVRIQADTQSLASYGIGIDTWGVDFALLGEDGSLCGNPRHYRDGRNNGMLEQALGVVSREEIFAQTGIQFMQINSLIQLYAMKAAGDPALASARTLLFMPDLFSYWLTGVARGELTIASTSQFYNPVEKRWAVELFQKLGLPMAILPEIVDNVKRINAALTHVRHECCQVRCVRSSAMRRGQSVTDPRQQGCDGTTFFVFCHGQKARQKRRDFFIGRPCALLARGSDMMCAFCRN